MNIIVVRPQYAFHNTLFFLTITGGERSMMIMVLIFCDVESSICVVCAENLLLVATSSYVEDAKQPICSVDIFPEIG